MTSRYHATVVALVAGLVIGCRDPSPPAPSVAGAWSGTAHVRPDVFTMTLTQGSATVAGSGTWQHTGSTEPFTVAGTFDGCCFNATLTAQSATLTYQSALSSDRQRLLGIVTGIVGGDRILDLTRQP